jgi:cell division initiation protein
MRGYKPEEVDSFLDEVIKDFEVLFRENHELKEVLQKAQEEIGRIKEMENSIQKAMVVTQKLIEDEKKSTEKETELILWEAKKQGERLVAESRDKALKFEENIDRLKLYERQLYSKFKGFLEFQMELLNGYVDNEAFKTEAMDEAKYLTEARSQGLGPREPDARIPELRSPEPRNAESRGLELRNSDPRNSEPRSPEPRNAESRGLELRNSDPRNLESRGLEPRGLEPRNSESRTPESRISDMRNTNVRGLDTQEPDGPTLHLAGSASASSGAAQSHAAQSVTPVEKEALLSNLDDQLSKMDAEHDPSSLERVLMAAERVEAILKSLDTPEDEGQEEGEVVQGPWRK